MTELDPDTDDREVQFLMDRYSQLVEEQMATNEIIHTTFYISIVVFGALVGVFPSSTTVLTRVGLSVFASGIFFAMFLWTKTYLNSRREINRKMSLVIEQFRDSNFEFDNIDSPDDFFSDPTDYHQDSWERDWTKERLLLVYYLGLSVATLAIPAVELL